MTLGFLRSRMGLRFVVSRPFDRAVAVAKGGATDKAREKTLVKAHRYKKSQPFGWDLRSRMGLDSRR